MGLEGEDMEGDGTIGCAWAVLDVATFSFLLLALFDFAESAGVEVGGGA